jgi:hypothetical protein
MKEGREDVIGPGGREGRDGGDCIITTLSSGSHWQDCRQWKSGGN